MPTPQLSFAICDAHHHLWDLSAVRYPWLNAPLGTERFFGDPTPIQRDYLVTDLNKDIGDLPIYQSVHIQVGAADDQHIAETAWVQSQIDASLLQQADSDITQQNKQLPSAMVAFADLASDDLDETLDKLQAFSGIRGIRQIIGRAPEEDQQTGSGLLLANSQWQTGLKELAKRSLRFDLQLIPSQMQQAYEVFKQVEDLQVVLCHCGSPWFLNPRYTQGSSSQNQSYELWKDGLAKLASLPNIHCKISGLSMFNREWRKDSIKFIFEHVVDAFSTERCMFGSNFPVDKLYVDYQALWQTYLQLTETFSPMEKKALFGENCRRFYQLDTH